MSSVSSVFDCTFVEPGRNSRRIEMIIALPKYLEGQLHKDASFPLISLYNTYSEYIHRNSGLRTCHSILCQHHLNWNLSISSINFSVLWKFPFDSFRLLELLVDFSEHGVWGHNLCRRLDQWLSLVARDFDHQDIQLLELHISIPFSQGSLSRSTCCLPFYFSLFLYYSTICRDFGFQNILANSHFVWSFYWKTVVLDLILNS